MADTTTFPIKLVKGGTYSHRFEFYQDDAATVPVDLTGKSPRILVKSGAGPTAEWTVTGGQVVVSPPASDGRMVFSLTLAEIQALTFKAAHYFMFLDGNDDLVLEGTVQVR